MSTAGQTGAQSIRLIPAPRVYVKAADITTAAPVEEYYTKSNGTTPAGWTDLGIVDGNVAITYAKKTTDVKTGLDNYLRAVYINEKTASATFNLSQFDDVALEKLTGLTASVITSGSVVNFQIGQDDLVQLATLFVVQNKLDGKEWQFYNPSAYLNFSIADVNNATVLKVAAEFPSFTADGASKESFFSLTEFA